MDSFEGGAENERDKMKPDFRFQEVGFLLSRESGLSLSYLEPTDPVNRLRRVIC